MNTEHSRKVCQMLKILTKAMDSTRHLLQCLNEYFE